MINWHANVKIPKGSQGPRVDICQHTGRSVKSEAWTQAQMTDNCCRSPLTIGPEIPIAHDINQRLSIGFWYVGLSRLRLSDGEATMTIERRHPRRQSIVKRLTADCRGIQSVKLTVNWFPRILPNSYGHSTAIWPCRWIDRTACQILHPWCRQELMMKWFCMYTSQQRRVDQMLAYILLSRSLRVHQEQLLIEFYTFKLIHYSLLSLSMIYFVDEMSSTKWE
jgi:hypothetical protein